MTNTTKIFVVLTTLFACIFTPLAIQFAARTEDWRKIAETYIQATQTAVANEQAMKAIAAGEIDFHKAERDRERARAGQLEAQVADLQRSLDELAQDKAQLLRDRDNWKTSTELQIAQAAILTQHNADLSAAKGRLTESESDLQSRNIYLSDRVNELMAQLVILKQQYEKVEQQMSACRQENDQLRADLGMGSAAAFRAVSPVSNVRPETPVAPSPVRGAVIDVRESLVTVDVGTSSGVREGLVLSVVRGGDFVADIEIGSQVSPNEAVGRITMTSMQGLQPRPGDVVTSELTNPTR